MGIVSSIGMNVEETLLNLKEKKSGVNDISLLKTNYSGKLPAAEIKKTNDELAAIAGLKSGHSRTTLLATIAAKQAIQFFKKNEFDGLKKGFISANTVGGMDLTEQFFADFLNDNESGNIDLTRYHDCGASTEIVAKEIGFTDFFTTISTACSSSANALMYGARLIRHGVLDICLCGGSDALSKFTLNGFNSLMILDNEACKPFDDERKGLNLGEGAAFLLLVSEKVAEKLSQKPTTYLRGFANKNDAFHQTASSPEGRGNLAAMQSAASMAQLEIAAIDYINLHGTGTQNNDSSEGIAIQTLFADKVPSSSTTKAYTGHTLGAAGAIEAVFSILAIEQHLIFPNLRFKTRLKELNFSPEKELIEEKNIVHVLSNSFGFGGNCSSIILSKAQ